MEIIDQDFIENKEGVLRGKFFPAVRIIFICMITLQVISILHFFSIIYKDYDYDIITVLALISIILHNIYQIFFAIRESRSKYIIPAFNYWIIGIVILINSITLLFLLLQILNSLTYIQVNYNFLFKFVFFICLLMVIIQDYKYMKWDLEKKHQ